MKKIIIVLIILSLVGFGGYLVFKEGTLPVNKNDKSGKIFVIRPGESLNAITNNLAKEDLIRSKVAFYLVVKQMGIEKEIQAGDFRLSSSMDAYQIANEFTHGTLDVWLTIIEGWRKEEVAQAVEKTFDIPDEEFANLAQEGYLFPDSYLIPRGSTADQILTLLKNTFNEKFNSDLKEKAIKNGLNTKEAVIFASLLEREAKTATDKQKVASILLKRYREDWPLQVDATVQYILGYQPGEKRWWKEYLTEDDLKIESPYNTYTNTGLPPEPICNPGLASLEAVANADPSTPYWYYISDLQGTMHYAKTLEEHNANIEKYLN